MYARYAARRKARALSPHAVPPRCPRTLHAAPPLKLTWIYPTKHKRTSNTREEEFYEREAVLGRDATSVFPKEAAAAAVAGQNAMVEALGARKFISETEVSRE